MKTIKDENFIDEFNNHFPLMDFFITDIRPYTSIVKFESEETILAEGEISPYLFYLFDGRAKLFLSHENGQVTLINFLNAPCFIGEMELIGAQELSNGVKAITQCTCYAIQVKDCKEQLLSDTKFLRHLCLFLGKKAIGNTYNYANNQSYSLEVRLAGFILMTTTKNIYRERHTEAAEYLGVTYRHLLYVLAGFVKRGILSKTSIGYCVDDLNTLRKIANAQSK